jgi:hypothetical protein
LGRSVIPNVSKHRTPQSKSDIVIYLIYLIHFLFSRLAIYYSYKLLTRTIITNLAPQWQDKVGVQFTEMFTDASHPISGSRFSQILSFFQPITPQSSTRQPLSLPDLLSNLTCFSTPSLAYLIALLAHPSQTFPPSNTRLIIIDSFSTLISSAFPRNVDVTATPKKPNGKLLTFNVLCQLTISTAPNPSARKFPVLQYIINALQKLAATRNIAIVVISQCVTKMRGGAGAVLVPAINTTAWEQGLGCRIMLFRDWGWDDDDGRQVIDVRLAQVIKAEGIAVPDGRVRFVGFTIGEVRDIPSHLLNPTCADAHETGLSPLMLPTRNTEDSIFSSPHLPPPLPTANHETPTLPQKRKLSATDLEIPDSEGEDDEDYGWAEEDEEELPPPPPQWQGSEDVLGPAQEDVEEEERDEELDFAEGAGDGAKGEIEDSEDELAL